MVRKQNCWEFMKCGKEVSGFLPDDFGVCPAVTCKTLHRVHGGINGGRACWMVTGTMCGKKIQGSYHYKTKNCVRCDFFRLVKREEIENFIYPEDLLNKAERII